MSHSKFGSPSSLYRLDACPGSVAYTKDIPDGQGSEHAVEGTEFHEYMEAMLDLYVQGGEPLVEQAVDGLLQGCRYPDMPTDVRITYRDVVTKWQRFQSKHTDCEMYRELRVSVSEDIFGTSDLVFVGKSLRTGKTDVVIIDYKYGRGVPVQAQGNLQGLAYLIGTIKTLGLRDIGASMFVVAQVRLDDGWSSAVYSPVELIEYENKILRIVSRVKAIYRGEYSIEANLHPGEHCRFCKANGVCVAQKAQTFDMIEATANELHLEDAVKTLTLDQQVAVFLKKKDIENFLEAVAKNIHRALASGVNHPLVKLVKTRGRRKWKELTTADDLKAAGVQYPTKDAPLVGVVEAEKQAGKGSIDHLVELSEGKEEVVSANDARPAVVGQEPKELQ